MGLNGFGPNRVAFFAQVQEVRHDLAGECTVFLKELGPDVEVVDVFAIIEFAEYGVGPFIDLTPFIGVVRAAWKYAK